MFQHVKKLIQKFRMNQDRAVNIFTE